VTQQILAGVIISTVILTRTTGILVPVPIAAFTIAAALFSANRKSAFITLFGALLISDLYLGFHHMMPAVYLSLVPIAFLACELKKTSSLSSVVAASVLSSVVYFGLSNFGVWLLSGCIVSEQSTEELSVSNLLRTYAAAAHTLPLRAVLDLLCSAVFFALHRSLYGVGSFEEPDSTTSWHSSGEAENV
jgi:hypothetical protein